MLRILFIIPTLDRSGAEKQLTMLATRLPRDQFEVEVCALTRGGPFEAELRAANVPVHVLGKRLKVDLVAAWKLRRILRRGRYDIVHTWLFAANWHGRALAILQGIPIVVASERCADEWKGTMERTIDRILAPRTDAIVVNSKAVLDHYQGQGIDASKLTVIPNGIACDTPPASDRLAVRRECEVPADAQVLGFVGRLWPQKRVRDAIWATEVLRNIKPNLYLLIVGDGPERRDLIEFTERIQVSHRVRFLGLRDDVQRLLGAMDIFVMPSQFEGMPNAVMEAMRAGLPVVASNIAGNSELVVEGETGLLYPVGETKALSVCLNRLLEDNVLRSKLGAAGQRRVQEEFTIEKMVDAHVRLYHDLASRRSAVPSRTHSTVAAHHSSS
jgi:glycosyltransferase involved in cell wall biosynthesis